MRSLQANRTSRTCSMVRAQRRSREKNHMLTPTTFAGVAFCRACGPVGGYCNRLIDVGLREGVSIRGLREARR